MPLQATSGAASYDAFGGGVAAVPQYIEDVFNIYLYTGNDTTQVITNGIDLATKGGLVWNKGRDGATNHILVDTAQGTSSGLITNVTDAAGSSSGFTSFDTTGFTFGGGSGARNNNGTLYCSWTFRKQPKFFDVVTWTSTNNANARISHNLGSVPGCYIIKRLDGAGNWFTYHTSLGRSAYLSLNATNASASATNCWGTSDPTTTDFGVNETFFTPGSGNYVAYLFAHNAGGFGLTGTDNVISCGSFTVDGSGDCSVSLGYEPQWIMVKSSTAVDNWYLFDNMRGFPVASADGELLRPNTSQAGITASTFRPTSTGFTGSPGGGFGTGIYIAIRRGPMKVPTVGTSVFYPYAASAPGNAVVTTGFPVDLQIQKNAGAGTDPRLVDRLRGVSTTPTSPSAAFPYLVSSDTSAETTGTGTTLNWGNTGFTVGNTYASSATAWAVNFKRAPSFFDICCYTGNGGINNVQNHALASSIGMLIVKRRDSTGNWSVFAQESGGNYSYWNSSGTGTGQGLSGTGAATGTNYSGFNTYLTSASFNAAQIAGSNDINANGGTFVAYLFATCAGVSKVGSYTGNGSSQTINCGFTGGARFVLIKKSSGTGDWMVSDSARGIVSGSDPYLELNNTNAEVTGEDWLDTDSTGFVVNEVSGSNANTNGATYIFLAIA